MRWGWAVIVAVIASGALVAIALRTFPLRSHGSANKRGGRRSLLSMALSIAMIILIAVAITLHATNRIQMLELRAAGLIAVALFGLITHLERRK